jgi:radical SAM protein (TIGR01212 family)
MNKTHPEKTEWNGLPFQPISQFYLKRFGGKVYKIPLAIADDCPNRRGLKGMKPCVFCDEWGSAAREEAFDLSLKNQIEKYRDHISKRYNAHQFLAYFQAYTNTFLKIQSLREHLETALAYPEILGFVIGTRPDCISKAVLDLWSEMAEKTFVAVELGVQSFFNPQLEFLSRGHTREDSINAIKKIAENPKINLGIHLIFGSPNETMEDIIETAKICNELPISNVKLHNLHVLKNTPLAEIYNRGEFEPISFEDYSKKVKVFLEHLSPNIYIHRLAAYSSRWDELIAPSWTANKMKTHQEIIDFIRAEKSYQGHKF